MQPHIRIATLLALAFVLPLPLAAQERVGVMGDLAKDVAEAKTKIVGLARAMPASAWDWRPGKGTRSTGEVVMHVAADNYFLPAAMGGAAPAETGIDGKEYKTAAAFEKRTMTRDQAIAELEKSFAFLEKSMADTPESKLGAPLEAFGQKMTYRALWISTATHLHEHLGQLIAYARSNDVVPPWSK
jgi:uncharacterized damage-inducible protein DinB